MFEVSKSEEIITLPPMMMHGRASPLTPVQTPRLANQCSLKVTVPAELEGAAYIFVCIRKGNFILNFY